MKYIFITMGAVLIMLGCAEDNFDYIPKNADEIHFGIDQRTEIDEPLQNTYYVSTHLWANNEAGRRLFKVGWWYKGELPCDKEIIEQTEFEQWNKAEAMKFELKEKLPEIIECWKRIGITP